jgi:uncharacterized protein YvpB
MWKLKGTTLEEIGNTITTGALHNIVWVWSTNIGSQTNITTEY